MKRGMVAQKRGQEPIVRSTRRAMWLLVPDPFSELKVSLWQFSEANVPAYVMDTDAPRLTADFSRSAAASPVSRQPVRELGGSLPAEF